MTSYRVNLMTNNTTTDMNKALNDAVQTLLALSKDRAMTTEDFEAINYVEDFFVNHVFDDDNSEKEYTYTLYWRHGEREVITGPYHDISQAMTAAGYGNVDNAGLDFYVPGDDTSYQWDFRFHEWNKVES